MDSNASVAIEEITASDTYPLRRAVLRNGDPDLSVSFVEDAHPGVFHLGARAADGTIVATSTWIPRPCAEPAVANAIQLRGMATATSVQGSGIGGLLFDAGAARCAEAGFDLLWARARDVALAFYRRHGCSVVGDGFIDEATQLPHHIVVLALRAAAD